MSVRLYITNSAIIETKDMKFDMKFAVYKNTTASDTCSV